MRIRRLVVLCAALLIGPALAWADDDPSAPDLMLTGTAVLDESVVRKAAGEVPPTPEQRRIWAPGAIERIEATYHSLGYLFARGWFRIQPDGVAWIHVDEGRVRIHFTGAGSVSAFFYKVDLNLPKNVFHGPTLAHALEELKDKHGLLNSYFRVKEPGETMVTPFGDAVPQRVLQIYIVRKEKLGLGFDISLSSTWGVLPGVSYDHKNLMLSDDRFHAKMELAFPFRRYLFDEDPKFAWVHGGIWCSYRLPRFLGKRIGLRPDTGLRLSRYERSDRDRSYNALRETTVGNLITYFWNVQIGVGAGVDAVWIFDVEDLNDENDETRDDALAKVEPRVHTTSSVRPLVRVFLRLDPDSKVLRRDQRTFAHTRLDGMFGRGTQWILNLDVKGQLFFLIGRHRLVLRGQGRLVAGEVDFYDEVQLAGSYQRVFFSNRYWVREVVQLEMAYRARLWWDWFEIGLFHDLSVFFNRAGEIDDTALANAFGPSVHFLLFDMFTLGIYQGFGFAPVGFDHTFSFNMQTIF